VTNVGDVANTKAPEPVSSVTVEARLALDGVARNVATPVPNPERSPAFVVVVVVADVVIESSLTKFQIVGCLPIYAITKFYPLLPNLQWIHSKNKIDYLLILLLA